ncbi:hypothetical protein TMSI_20620 [Klebsiella quasipneumoniae]|uniref:hypothetical protein n=1 Tax=Klebsiella quasipneumoniae TaxID=1463165 RepID=UPI00125385E8|nr:hypothetical protein [Klebsiella quasipneumoniae]BBK11670.1 hypothetical protein TMSI_20620 [Klebsiella quasipneumoniae]
MTDITELAQRLKLEVHRAVSNFNPQMNIKTRDLKELVEALEKAQAKATQQGNIACVLLDEVTQLRRHADEKAPELRAQLIEADSELEALRQRIAELESRTVTVKLPKPHAHLIWIQAGHAPDDYWDDVAVSHSEKDRCCDGSERYPVYARWEIEEMLTAAGIKVEAE